MANRQQAKNMANRGSTAKEIRQATGVTGQSARNIVNRAASRSQESSPAASMQINQPNGDRIVTQAPTRPANVQESYVDAGSGKRYPTAFIPGAMQPGQVGYDPATGGGVWAAGPQSAEDIRAWYRSSSPGTTAIDKAISSSGKDASAFTLEGLYGSAMPSTAAATAQVNKAANKKSKNLSGSIRSMGVGGLTKKELASIMEGTKKSGGDVIQKLDALNRKFKQSGQVGINLNSGAANMLIREATKNPTMDSFYKYGGKPTFGTGKIGQTLGGMLGTRSTGGYINPQSGQQSITPGTERTLLARGMDLMPSGRQTVRGIGKQFVGMPTAGETATGATGATEASPITAPEMLPELPPEENNVDQMMPGSSADLANWATGFKTARSSRKRSGPRAQGLASQRVNPTGVFRGGM